MPAGAVQGNIECGTTKDRAVDVECLLGLEILNCESRRMGSIPTSTNGANVTGPAMVNAIFQVGDQADSPPGKTICVDRNRNGVGALQRIGRILGDDGAIRVAQSESSRGGKKRHRRNGTDIEAAQVVFATSVEALEGRRHHSAVAGQERTRGR